MNAARSIPVRHVIILLMVWTAVILNSETSSCTRVLSLSKVLSDTEPLLLDFLSSADERRQTSAQKIDAAIVWASLSWPQDLESIVACCGPSVSEILCSARTAWVVIRPSWLQSNYCALCRIHFWLSSVIVTNTVMDACVFALGLPLVWIQFASLVRGYPGSYDRFV